MLWNWVLLRATRVRLNIYCASRAISHKPGIAFWYQYRFLIVDIAKFFIIWIKRYAKNFDLKTYTKFHLNPITSTIWSPCIYLPVLKKKKYSETTTHNKRYINSDDVPYMSRSVVVVVVWKLCRRRIKCSIQCQKPKAFTSCPLRANYERRCGGKQNIQFNRYPARALNKKKYQNKNTGEYATDVAYI